VGEGCRVGKKGRGVGEAEKEREGEREYSPEVAVLTL